MSDRESEIMKDDRSEPVEGASTAAGCLTIPGVLFSLMGMAAAGSLGARAIWTCIGQIVMLIIFSFSVRNATSKKILAAEVLLAIGFYALLWSICMAGVNW